jgi:Tol biopolymer transport system component
MFRKRLTVSLLVLALASLVVPGVSAQGDETPSTLPVPPGRLVIADDDGLYSILPDGTDKTVLVADDDANCWIRDGIWNPDMTVLAYTRICGGDSATDWHGDNRTANLFLYDPDSGESTELIPNDGVYQDYAASWHPDGNRLAIYSNRADSERYNLYVVDTTSGDVTQLTDFGDDTGRASYDPTGRYLMYNRYVAREEDSEWEIRVLDTETDVEVPVAVGLTPHWSPDGQWIAYATEGDVSDVFILPAACIYENTTCEPDVQARNVTYTPDVAEREPVFSPDQTQIAYLRDADVDPIGFTWDVYRQEIRTGVSQNLTSSTAMQERLTSWEPAPDAEMADIEPLLPVIARVQTSTPANLRAEPSTNGARVGTAINGRIVFMQGANEARDWYLVTLPEDGATAWIFGDLVSVVVGSADTLPVTDAAASAQPQ